jgi:uncharacterized protein (DUF433 family)
LLQKFVQAPLAQIGNQDRSTISASNLLESAIISSQGVAMAEKQHAYKDRITINPQIMVGKPVVKGTRIPVELVVAHLANDPDLNDLFAAYPDLTVADVKACLQYAHLAVVQMGKAARKSARLKEALGMVGAWSDLDLSETLDALDRIRHESKPTPPIKR